MDGAIFDPATNNSDREPVIHPFGCHAAAPTSPAPRGLPYGGSGALATSRGLPLATTPKDPAAPNCGTTRASKAPATFPGMTSSTTTATMTGSPGGDARQCTTPAMTRTIRTTAPTTRAARMRTTRPARTTTKTTRPARAPPRMTRAALTPTPMPSAKRPPLRPPSPSPPHPPPGPYPRTSGRPGRPARATPSISRGCPKSRRFRLLRRVCQASLRASSRACLRQTPRAFARAGVPRRQPSVPARSGRPYTWRRRDWCDDPERSF